MLGQIEHLDVAALVAPRPLLIESGGDDDLFPAQVATVEFTKLRSVYESLGVAERVEHDVFDGGHEWHGVVAYRFLERWL
jgi:hypothetical protein